MDMAYRIDRVVRNKVSGIVLREKERRKAEVLSDFKKSEPVIVLGNQKTGSTAIAALLAKCTEKTVTLDIVDPIPDPSWQLIYKYQLDDFENFIFYYKNYFSREIIKEPSLTFFYSDLLQTFPNAKYVMILRNPYENIRSILNRLGIPGNRNEIEFSDWDSLKYYPTWKLALDSTWLGCQSNNYIEALAWRWCKAADVYLENTDRLIVIKYEDFLSNKMASIEGVAEKLAMDVTSDIKNHVDIQFQGKGNSTLKGIDFFGERNYKIIKDICGERSRGLGYNI